MNPEGLLLRDIHLPEPVSWWPPAIGWWLVAVALVLLIAIIVSWRRRRQAQRSAPATIARVELARLTTAWTEHRDENRLVGELSTWLRRASMSMSSRRTAASLTGADWLDFLNETAGEQIFGGNEKLWLLEAPYGKSANVKGDDMLALCERWLTSASRATKGTPA
jgi:hypothetical protein